MLTREPDSIDLFAAETGATVVAEGVETAQEWQALDALGVPAGQGYWLGRPAPLADALAWLDVAPCHTAPPHPDPSACAAGRGAAR